MSNFTAKLASPTSTPPTSSSYWVVPDLLLAGAYPGHPDPDEHDQRVKLLVGAGIRMFLNLMEEDETNYAGEPFVPYQDLAAGLCPEVACVRHPVRDLSTPTTARMVAILDAIDDAMKGSTPVYVHCWGGSTTGPTRTGGHCAIRRWVHCRGRCSQTARSE